LPIPKWSPAGFAISGQASAPQRPAEWHKPLIRYGTFPIFSRFRRSREGLLDQANHYAELEQGARYLASLAANDAERFEHLSWANRYYRLRLDALSEQVTVALAC